MKFETGRKNKTVSIQLTVLGLGRSPARSSEPGPARASPELWNFHHPHLKLRGHCGLLLLVK
ncbi:hypothetical protein CKAN_01725900 [Cinnamomum micranthum f. kanehirae]|uniref:Uncharacterized protein n=1 Tax=Cinnamomum micranthum f. kanehirae TaxID=337451 RepID=A0A3S3NII8_9MAGN|nr:hypothetical protein CKAN_01725900 [Cinnamomum micranthum f. kanehirae]